MITARIYVFGTANVYETLLEAISNSHQLRLSNYYKTPMADPVPGGFNHVMVVDTPSNEFVRIAVEALPTERIFIQGEYDGQGFFASEYEHGTCVYHIAGNIVDPEDDDYRKKCPEFEKACNGKPEITYITDDNQFHYRKFTEPRYGVDGYIETDTRKMGKPVYIIPPKGVQPAKTGPHK